MFKQCLRIGRRSGDACRTAYTLDVIPSRLSHCVTISTWPVKFKFSQGEMVYRKIVAYGCPTLKLGNRVI